MSQERAFTAGLLTLLQIPNVGAARLRALISVFHSPERVLASSPSELMRVEGVGESIAMSIVNFAKSTTALQLAETKATHQLELAEKLGATLLTVWDDTYPTLLKQIYDPPVCLFVRGSLAPDTNNRFAIVGTRYPTEYGKNAVKKFTAALAQNGFEIVSGLAYGVDTAAHYVALESGARTIAVLGCGIDKIYTDPKGKLYPRIMEQGAILSEEWIGTEPLADNFPKRNRIISGLSKGVLIVESDFKGGALLTANYAIEQNRDVFAVPGSIFSHKSNGTNALIRDSKAKLVLSPEDILSELKFSPTNKAAEPQVIARPNLSDAESIVYGAINDEPTHIDAIADSTGLEVSDVLVILFELEFKAHVRQLPGKFFQKVV